MCETPAPYRNSTTPRQITAEVQLLVEGADLEGFCEGVRRHLARLPQGIDQRDPDPVQAALEGIQIQDFGGVTQLREFLKVFVKMPGFSGVTSVGIIRDAEGNAGGAFESVRGCLEDAGLQVPNRTGERVGEHPAITVMVLPGDNQAGMLETLLCETFREEDVRTCIDTFFECVEEVQGEAVHRPGKARVRAYLATKRDPHLSIGVAARRGYWNLNHPALQPLCQFLIAVATG